MSATRRDGGRTRLMTSLALVATMTAAGLGCATPAGAATSLDGLGESLVDVDLSSDGARAYVLAENAPLVSVLDTATETVIGQVAVEAQPWALASGTTVHGERVYVTSSRPGPDAAVSVIDPLTMTVVAEVETGSSVGIAMAPDGSRVFVASRRSLKEIDTATNVVVRSTEVAADETLAVAVAPDGERVYVTSRTSTGQPAVAVLDVSTGQVLDRLLTPTDYPVEELQRSPYGAVVSPDGSRLYVSDEGAMILSIIDTSSFEVVDQVSLPWLSYGLAITPDGGTLHIANRHTNAVVVVDTETLETRSQPAPAQPISVALGSTGRLYVAGFTGLLTVVAPPEVELTTPASGPVAGGTSVTIIGDRFDGTTSVTFGGVEASFTVDSDEQITAVAPAAAAGVVEIVLTSPDGAGRPASYTYVAPAVATTLVADPVLRTVPDLVAHLSEADGGAQVAGKQVTFTGQLIFLPVHLCSATTDASGTARCSSGLVGLLGLGSYTATFVGDTSYLPSSARGALL